MSKFSDEDLTAYLDGEANPELARAIEYALMDDAALSQRLSDLDIDLLGIKQSFDELLNAAPKPPEAPIEAVAPVTGSSIWMKMAAASVLALGLGLAIGSWRSSSDLDEWQDYAAAYHKLYTTETLASADFSQSDLTAQLDTVSKAIGADISLENIASFEGLTMQRAQVLGFEGAKIAHIALTDKSGAPVALCIAKLSDQTRLDLGEKLGMSTARWGNGTHSFYLIGGDDDVLINAAATISPVCSAF